MSGVTFLPSRDGAVAHAAASLDGEDRIVVSSINQFTGGAPWRVSLMHDRAENLLVWITRGQGLVHINGIRRGVGAHNALFIPAGSLFALDLGQQSAGQVISSPLGRTGKLPKTAMHLRVRNAQAQSELTGEIEAMERELRERRPHTQEALAAHLGLVAVWLRRQDTAGAADLPEETAAQRLVRRFARLVTAHHTTDMAMQDYAARLDVTPTHLTRVCRECSGFTAADILTARKLYAAKTRLIDGDEKMQDIAQSLGFHSAAYFTRFVQSHTGHAPSALRQRHQQPESRR